MININIRQSSFSSYFCDEMDRLQGVSFPSSGLRQERIAPSELASGWGSIAAWRGSRAAWGRRVRTRVQLAAITAFVEGSSGKVGNRSPTHARLSGPQRLIDLQACGYRSLDLSSFARDGRNVVKSRRDYPVFLGREFPSSSSGRTSPTPVSSAAATASSTRSNQTNSS